MRREDKVGGDKSGVEVGGKYYGQAQEAMVFLGYLGDRGYERGEY